jgi:hypothetical protein
VTGDCHAGICEGREVRFLPATRPRCPDTITKEAVSSTITQWRNHLADKGNRPALLALLTALLVLVL